MQIGKGMDRQSSTDAQVIQAQEQRKTKFFMLTAALSEQQNTACSLT